MADSLKIDKDLAVGVTLRMQFDKSQSDFMQLVILHKNADSSETTLSTLPITKQEATEIQCDLNGAVMQGRSRV